MNHTLLRFGSALAVLIILPAASCTSSPSSPAKAPLHSLAGGCSGTVVTDSVPPAWAQNGFTHKSAPWAVPWALGTDSSVVAFVFGSQLVAGTSPAADGRNNKINWVIKERPSTALIEGRPLGMAQPVVSVRLGEQLLPNGGVMINSGGSSIIDVPTGGCWTFLVLWGAHNEHRSIINLEVLPAGAPLPK